MQLLDADANAIGYRDIFAGRWRFEWGPEAWRAPIISAAGGLSNLVGVVLLAFWWDMLGQPALGTTSGDLMLVGMASNIADVARLVPPGHLDGGDVLKIDRTAYVGLGTRTDLAGLDQLRTLLRPRGWTVIGVPVHRVLHLKSAVTALPDGTVIGFPPNVDDPDAFDEFLAVPEEHGTAVVDLGGGTILISASAPRTAELLRGRGLTVIPTPLTEFEKLEGCVTCLSVRMR